MADCTTPDIITPEAGIFGPETSYNIVKPEIASATAHADYAYGRAMGFLDALLNYIADNQVSNVNVDLGEVDLDVPNFVLPSTPQSPNISINLPNLPAEFVPGDIADIDLDAIGNLPTFNVSAPTISLPTTPSALNKTFDEDEPSITTTFNFPDAPTYTLPSVPTFEELDIPSAPTLSIPDFDQLLPVTSDVNVPSISFYWGDEDPYSDDLLVAVKASLLDWVQNGGTGLPVDVEQAIFDRGRNREDINSIRSENQVLKEQASRGFSRPSGSTVAALDYLAQETQNKTADLSREIMIKQAELEQANMQFAIQQAIALEQLLINENQQIQQRSFEAAKYVQDVAINIFNAELAKVNIALEGYKAYAAAYEAQVRAALSRVEIFKAEIEAQGLISQINRDSVLLYNAQLDAIKTSVEVYKTEVDAIASQIQSEGLKIENYKSLIQAFAAEVEAKKVEYQGYAEAIKGELAKVDIYDSQVKAFVGRIDAYGKAIDAQSKISDIDIETEKLRLQTYLGQLDAVIKQVQAETAIYSTQVDVYRGQAAMYQAEVGALTSANELAIKEADTKVRFAVAEADVAIKNAEVNLQNVRSVDQFRLQALISGADVAKGLSQASLAALHIGASVSTSDSTNVSYSNQRSAGISCNENHNYDEL